MKTPEEKYNQDSAYHRFVDVIENLLHQAEFTPSEVREMAMYACIRYEERRPPRPIFLKRDPTSGIGQYEAFNQAVKEKMLSDQQAKE